MSVGRVEVVQIATVAFTRHNSGRIMDEMKRKYVDLVPTGNVTFNFILYTFSFYKQLHFRPPEPQISENRSNLASCNCRASNRKFLATFEPPIRNT